MSSLEASLLSATAERVEAELGVDGRGTLVDRITRTMSCYEGRDLWRATFDWYHAARSATIARRGPFIHDVAVVGGGPLALHVSAAVRRLRPDASVIVLNDRVGSRPYEATGRAFRLNTARGTATVRHPLPGVRLRDLCNEVFAPALVLADAARLSTLVSGAEVWSWATVSGVQRRQGVWELVVEHANAHHLLKARDVVIATGFGAPRDDLFVPSLRATAAMPPHEAPGRYHFTAEAFLAHVAWGANACTRWGRIAVVGSGPSALAVISVVLGLTPGTLAHVDLASVRSGARVTWYLGRRSLEGVMGWGSGGGPIDAMLRERYAELRTCVQVESEAGRLTMVPDTEVRRVSDAASGLAVDGAPFDTVVDCSGYRPYQLETLLPGFTPDEVMVEDEVGRARGCYLLGDAILPLLPETPHEGPLEQWARSANVLGERLAAGLREVAPTPVAEVWTPELTRVTLSAPSVPCTPTQAEIVGARIALDSALSSMTTVAREVRVTENQLVVVGAAALVDRAIGQRTRSILLSNRGGMAWV